MKIKPTDKVTCELYIEEYERFSCGKLATIRYTGDWENVLNTISDNHSYSWKVGLNEDGEIVSCDDVFKSIEESNGDGCDFIIKWSVEKNGKKKELINCEDVLREEQELIDCD